MCCEALEFVFYVFLCVVKLIESCSMRCKALDFVFLCVAIALELVL